MPQIKLYSLSCVAIPLLSALINGFWGKQLGRKKAHSLACGGIGISCVLACIILKSFLLDNIAPINFSFYSLMNISDFNIESGFLIDTLSALMMCVVTFISLMVHIYSIGYMHEDKGYQRFFSYLSMFTFAMLMLIMANNFVQLFFGWEAVGLISYLLIGFWYNKPKAIHANLKAFLINRAGDLGFLVGIAGIAYCFKTLDYELVFNNLTQVLNQNLWVQFSSQLEFPALSVICFCLFIGAMAKSAQIPLHVWLPDSMEGPTPISALIHAATMVTAGIYMVARLSPLFQTSFNVLNFILITGSLTSFLMAILSLVQSDIKRIIAFSTISQLGYMVAALGASYYHYSIFHLVTHAFFKSLLFLSAGSVILYLHHEQNIWKMGGLRKTLPITYYSMLIATLALVGFPFTSGFYSKDLIIEAVGQTYLPATIISQKLLELTIFITALYSFRLIFVVFHGRIRDNNNKTPLIPKQSMSITIPLLILSFFSLGLGYVLFLPLLNGLLADSILIPHYNLNNESALSYGLSAFNKLPVFLMGAGMVTAWVLYIKKPDWPGLIAKRLKGIHIILLDEYGFNGFYLKIIVPLVKGLGNLCYRLADLGLIDNQLVNGSATAIGKLALSLKKWQSGYLYHYAFSMILGFVVYIVWLMVR
ncbi:MAG: NADH-quinone oxidoreductase subunit [Francisellaceae bacterium]|nr:NADH-quinone oxidoreductase subunit [Francisellaceae bacterium]